MAAHYTMRALTTEPAIAARLALVECLRVAVLNVTHSAGYLRANHAGSASTLAASPFVRHFPIQILIVLFHLFSFTLPIYYPRPQMAFTRSLLSLDLAIFLVTFSRISRQAFSPLLDSGGPGAS